MAMLALALDCQMLDQVQQRVIGTAATLLMNDPSLRGAMAQILSEEVVPASRHGKLAFFLNFDRVPVGFITWAHLSEERRGFYRRWIPGCISVSGMKGLHSGFASSFCHDICAAKPFGCAKQSFSLNMAQCELW